VTPIESILAELLEEIRPLLGSRVPTQNLLEEALASIMLDSRIKELLGRQVTASGVRGSSDAEQWQALFAALSAGLCAQSDQAVAVAAAHLQAEFNAIVSSKGKKWLAFIPPRRYSLWPDQSLFQSGNHGSTLCDFACSFRDIPRQGASGDCPEIL
jgi:hypothetical protein